MMGWMAETLIASSLLMALVMMVRVPVARSFGPRIAYMLWALPAVRMILPPLPTQSAAAMVLPDATTVHAAMPVTLNLHFAALAGGASPTAQQSATQPFPWLEAGIALWIAGAGLFLLFQAFGYIRFRNLILRDARTMQMDDGPVIAASPRATGPLAFGIWRKYIILPANFADHYLPREQELAIAHERAHHRRGDLIANMFALILLGLHWCNPIAWFAYRAFRVDQEMACDALVLGENEGRDAQAYGRTILKAASGRHFAPVCHLNTIDELKGRLKMLSSHERSIRRINMGMTAVAILIATGLALTASGSEAAQRVAAVSETVANAKLTKLAAYLPEPAAVPTVPAVPAAPEAEHVPAVPQVPEVPEVADDDYAMLQEDDLPEPPAPPAPPRAVLAPHAIPRSEEHTSELQSH